MPLWLWAGFWGLLAGSALLIGAAVGFLARVPQRLIAGIMAFGGGVLRCTSPSTACSCISPIRSSRSLR